MPDDNHPKPEILVDSDWKNQAQAEKDKLAEFDTQAAAPKGGPDDLPPADFQSLLGMLATQAIMYLGGMADRRTGQAVIDLELSRHFIDLIAVLEDKTKGNISKEETDELTGLLQELRTRYVEIARAVSKSYAEQQSKHGPGSSPAPPGASPIIQP